MLAGQIVGGACFDVRTVALGSGAIALAIAFAAAVKPDELLTGLPATASLTLTLIEFMLFALTADLVAAQSNEHLVAERRAVEARDTMTELQNMLLRPLRMDSGGSRVRDTYDPRNEASASAATGISLESRPTPDWSSPSMTHRPPPDPIEARTLRSMAERYEFSAELWQWEARTSSWFFVSVPPDVADEIDDQHGGSAAGFGSLPVAVTIGATSWETSIFPSKQEESYVLPVKKAVRTAESLGDGDTARVRLTVRRE